MKNQQRKKLHDLLWQINCKFRFPESVKGELNPKVNFSSFEHLGIVEQLYPQAAQNPPGYLGEQFCGAVTNLLNNG